MFHRAIDSEPVIAGVDLRCLEMTAYIEELRRGEIRAELIERHLQIGWLLLANDEARRRGMISFDTDAAHTGSPSNGLAGHSAGARFDNPEGSAVTAPRGSTSPADVLLIQNQRYSIPAKAAPAS